MLKYWIALTLFLTSCGYHFGQGSLPSQYHTMTVPYVCGDSTGELTSSLIKELSRSGAFIYHQECADLILRVSIVDYYEDNIGYRYDVKDHDGDGEDYEEHKKKINKRSIIPVETRISVLAEVSVVEACSGCVKLGPAQLKASIDYDHDYYYSPLEINQFSLGQLTDVEEARCSVMRPLSKVLAEKIIDLVVHSW